MEEDFPRGAVSRRTTRSADDKEKCFVQLSSKRSLEDVLFKDSEQATPSKGKKKRKTKKSEDGVTEKQALEEEFEGETERDGVVPKPLTAKTLTEGMLVLAVIQEIHEYEIVLSLPNGLTAFVQITDISSYFTQQLQDLNESTGADDQELPNIRDVYEVGNLVPCKIKSLGASKDGHRRIQASLDYEEINSELSISLIKVGMTLHGCISSIEDHGYTINLGIKGTNAFLAKDDAARGAKGRTGEAMKAGKLVTCLVKAVKSNGRSIILTFDQERLKSSKATKSTHTTFSSLIPGTRLDVLVTKVLPNSLITDVFGLYKGCVDPIHLKDTADELTKYEIGQKVTAVILYNCPTTKSIGLSLNPIHQKLSFDLTTDFIRDLSPGDIVEDALVVRVQEKDNLIVQLNKKMRGIVYYSHGSDDKQKRHSPASTGERVRCRILNFNLFDRLAIVSLRQSILDKPFLGINDVKPGMLVTGVIESVMPRGVAVKIQDRIHGFVPRTHLADIPVQKPQERFTVGSEIELRVLLVEPSKRRVLLTHKKTMVKSSLPILASYSQPKVGMWVHGCVVAVKDFGCIVSFYNDVKGIIPRAELGIDDSASPADNFYVGQVLKCQVVRTHNPESKKLSLSLRKDSRREQESFEPGKSCTTQTGELEVLATMETEHDRLMEESDEDNEVDLLDEQDTTEETDRRRKETLESNNEGRNKEKTEEFDRDTQYEIDYFQEIAESMKVFASMMVDMKVVKVEIKGIKEMLKTLAGKVECVIEGRAQNEQQRLREKRNTGRIVKDNLLARRRKYMHGKGIRKFDSRRLMMSKNVVNGKSDEVERRQTVEATGRVFTKNTSGDGHRDGVHEKHGERIDALRKMPEKNLVETRNDVSRVMTQDNLGNLNREDMNVSGGEDKMMTEKNLDGMRDSIMHDHATSNNNGQNENCTGIESLQESDDEDVGTVDVFFNVGSDSEEDSLGVQDECARSKDYDSVESCKREKKDRSIASSRLSQQDEESFAQGVVNEEVAKPQENFRWEKLPEGKINRLRSLPIGRFALEIVKNLVRSDILMKSNCTGKHTSTTSIPHVQAIDPGILEYALETTYEVFDVEEREKHRVRRECVSRIDSHCRYLRKVARRAPRKSTIEKGRIGANQEERLPGNVSMACPPTTIAPVPVEERHLEEQAIIQSKKSEISEEKGSRRKMPKNSYGQTDGEDDQTGMLGNDKVKEDTELDNRRHDCARNSDEQDASVIAGKGRQYGIEWALKGLPWKKLTDVDISNFKSHFRSAAAFATHAITHIVSDRVLINSNCFGKTRSDSGRPNVQPIDPDILAYVIERTFDAYGIEEQDQTKCRKECFMAIDSHCRDLFASSKRRKTGCASGMQRNVMKQIDGECGSGEKIGRKEGSSAKNSEGFKEVMSEESTGIKSTCHSLADKDIARVKGSGPTLPKFVARVLRLFLTDDILAISNCSGKSSSGRPNIQRIDPNIVAYILETVYDVYDVDEFDKADFRRKCIIAIDQCCRNEKKKRCKKETAKSSVNGNVPKRKGTKIQSEKEQEESV